MGLHLADAALVAAICLALLWCLSSVALWTRLPSVPSALIAAGAGREGREGGGVQCSGRGVPGPAGRCLCKGKWVGPRCELCSFPLYGSSCGSSGVRPGAAAQRPRLGFSCGTPALSATCPRLRLVADAALSEGWASAEVYEWDGSLKGPVRDLVDLLVLTEWMEGMHVAVRSFARRRPSAVIVTWLWANAAKDALLWGDVPVQAHFASSPQRLGELNVQAPAAALPAAAVGSCRGAGRRAVNVTLVGERPPGAERPSADSAVDELHGFGVQLWGAGWAGRDGWQGPLPVLAGEGMGAALAAYAAARVATAPLQAGECDPDAAPVAALDAYQCGAAWITLPGSPAEAQLRAEVPLGVYPQSAFDMRVQVDRLLRDEAHRQAGAAAAVPRPLQPLARP
eukprot:TRINITY_DN20678_c0_g1_i2.p1 TRINITY_DN20678_c0_g1~~TRINITY_DN20678_c0_g1_i2.p1  ORF type:complete len:419 (+),score=92.12 TRINITY_DN20678_c0_g1_i2:68-1258(+)